MGDIKMDAITGRVVFEALAFLVVVYTLSQILGVLKDIRNMIKHDFNTRYGSGP